MILVTPAVAQSHRPMTCTARCTTFGNYWPRSSLFGCRSVFPNYHSIARPTRTRGTRPLPVPRVLPLHTFFHRSPRGQAIQHACTRLGKPTVSASTVSVDHGKKILSVRIRRHPRHVGAGSTHIELAIIARFRALDGQEEAVAAALCEQVQSTRGEPGCLQIGAYASTRDRRLFFIQSRWADEAAFDVHAELPRTKRFVETMESLIDHPFDVARVKAIA